MQTAETSTEKKEAAFKRLAQNRTNRILRDLQLLGNLSNRNNYTYNKEDVDEIFNAIDKTLKLSKDRFNVEMNKNLRIKIDYEGK
ncbi:hypothetical protein A2380_00975 [candidate division WWE3 bacterium RIFOXYB1_FULL_43_24]|uniref:Uncharacterized protein n=1 Tax=candidate division WWE3 bacterium GW2011_GWF1_42_14 TaxID=1619138 RepID=A0A0G0YRQ6_UNCKA|nr:MAG: hypothetical protein UU92_C0005G0111 [candidate division WWE3 bacterium GW2011_GWA1_42_12]KKS34165.1 MAG: hypothetical protein UU97_C0014G0016 [candidate division WWE3 bacterium GW2011_GWD1_42_14]KKS39279.1 MAG: hypothetical protein UV00_C0003G0111 [candidate division WWE3 bacterium GW2011_GWF1_42_14]KKS40777.1 MAG: hypothetical protein UV03_C0003G0090 [candidate division WWE3 bacterium GW2011_GWE1_42_16]OGC60094.1 MAG: hypothetical protein A2212_00275 [candidate division WWE3 bacterium